MEKTLVILKPDTVERKLIGKIITRFEEKGYNIKSLKMLQLDKDTAISHYDHINHLPIFNEIIEYIVSGPVILLILEGENVIKSVRNLVGKTSSFEAEAGTIRGDYGCHIYKNLVHASDSKESAEKEIKRLFPEYMELEKVI
jgi:nucleoside-diphosphate kinase